MLEVLLIQKHDQGDMSHSCQAINHPEVILPGFMVEYLHSYQTAYRSTENPQG
jgi:hypothetical protein